MKITLLILVIFALSRLAQAVTPAPDGGYPGGNTAEGQQALLSLTTGTYNTAVGFLSLRSNTQGQFNTAIGAGALSSNSIVGLQNTPTGVAVGSENTATGAGALFSNTSGFQNTANGAFALFSNTEGTANTAIGDHALVSNTTGGQNTAIGGAALNNNTAGNSNTAVGVSALVNNTTGFANTAVGQAALANNTTGSDNIAIGLDAGNHVVTGNGNIDIGNNPVADESDTIRIGSMQTRTFINGIHDTMVSGTAVVVSASGQLGVPASSARFKDDIKPMDNASEAILALNPVTFRYKKEIDPARVPQFGLVAEEVEKVNPDLIVRDKKGKPLSVRYDAVNAMLLNEFLKEHRTVQKQEGNITALETTVAQHEKTIARQQNGIDEVMARLSEQAAQIQKLSAHVNMNRSATEVVVKNR
jgi:uncharacterized coiled-coil protein SlyX